MKGCTETKMENQKNNITIDEDELFKQRLEEIEGDDHSFVIKIGVPELGMEEFMKKSGDAMDCAPLVSIQSGKEGVNAMTRAMTAIVLKETMDSLLEDTSTKAAYEILRLITTQKTHSKEVGRSETDDSN